jgi:DNA end-binding protein Ku
MAASVWKGHLIFGMVSFPIRLFSAARSETISFNLLHKDDHSRIKQVTYCQARRQADPARETRQGLRVREGPLRGDRRRGHQEGGAARPPR